MTGKGLFIDLDGTLADSVTALKAVYFAFLKGFGIEGSEAEFRQLNGPPLVKIIDTLKESHNLPGGSSELIELYSAMIQRAHESASPVQGAAELLEHARRQGWNVAVVTSSSRHSVREWLKRNELLDRVDAVVGGDDVVRGKPAPEPYHLALSCVNSVAAKSLAVEDTRIGAASAVAAGLSTWVLADPRDRSDWPAEVGFIDRLTDLIKML